MIPAIHTLTGRRTAPVLQFVAGFGLLQGLIVGATFALNSQIALSEGSRALLLLTLLVIPTAAAWMGAATMNGHTPRRLFDGRVRRPVARLVLGASAAVAATPAIILLASLLSERIPDAVTTGGGAGVFAAASVLFLARRRAGSCVHCGYDLGSLPVEARCPECGATEAR